MQLTLQQKLFGLAGASALVVAGLALVGEASTSRVVEGEHETSFRNAVAATQSLPLEPGVKDALAAARPEIEAYIVSARAMGELALRDPVQAQSRLPDFYRRPCSPSRAGWRVRGCVPLAMRMRSVWMGRSGARSTSTARVSRW